MCAPRSAFSKQGPLAGSFRLHETEIGTMKFEPALTTHTIQQTRLNSHSQKPHLKSLNSASNSSANLSFA
jgi:hypothetical protein